MFTAFRALFKSKLFTAVLFSLLVVSFIGLGIRGSTQGGGSVSNWVIKSGDRAVDASEFKRRFDAEKKQLEQQNGPISIEQVALNGLDQQVLHVMAGQESISALSQKQGIQASDAQVATELRKNTALFNQITGQFDQQAYAERLAENGMTPTIFEGLLRDDLTNQHLASGMAAGLRAPRIATAWIGAYYLEQRTVSMFVLDPSMVAKPAQPTDAELAAFLKANAAR
ncbi:MAG: SurA N-terminal domain-containing protein, partial [Alphaproteobacteria bacterium]